MKKTVEDVLLDLGIYPNLAGFRYICKAMDYIAEDNSIRMYELYDKIAKDYDTTESKVERAIRHALSRADKECETYRQYMSVKDTSNSAMLFTLAERLKKE